MTFEPYILFTAVIALIFGIILFYASWQKFEILIFLFPISTWIASLFYNNVAEWISGEIATGPGGYLRASLLMFVGLMGLIKFIRTFPIHKGKVPVHLVILFVFLLYSFASFFYSIDANTTLIRTTLFTALFFFLLGLNSWLDSEEKLNGLLNTLFIVVTFLLIVSFLAMFVSPSRVWWWKTPSRFIGLWSHPNELGGFNMVSYPIILWKYYKEEGNKKYIAIAVLLLNFLIHFLTGSRTSLLASMVGFFLWFLLQKSWLKLIFMTVFAAIALFIITQTSISNFSRDEGSKITDLSERGEIWDGAIILAKEKPILGYGYAVESKIFANQNKYDLEGTFLNVNAQQPLHNGYLSIFVGGGGIGLFLWLILILIPLFTAFISEYSLFKLYAITTMIPILISNIVESAITGYLSASDIFFWLAWIVAGKLYLLKMNIAEANTTNEKHFSTKEILQNG